MPFRSCRRRHWAGTLTILAFFILLYGSYYLLSVRPSLLYPETGSTKKWHFLMRTDFRISLRKPVLGEQRCNTTHAASLSELGFPDIVQEALSLRPTFRGFQNKTDILNPVNWRPEFKKLREDKAVDWAVSRIKHTREFCEIAQPPLQFPGCLVHINHAYRFIWIKGKKVGGTTIREPLGWICGDHWRTPEHINMEFCSERWHKNETTSMEEARQYWKDYFVFAFIRNPYSRYSSSYTYINGFMRKEKRIPFGQACRQPFLQALLPRSKALFAHNVHHIMEQSSCLFTQEGMPAVDFIGETERLSEDLQTVMDEINKRKNPDLPDLEMPEHLKSENANKHQDYALPLYAKHPACLRQVEKHFWIDFERLGYEHITWKVSNRSKSQPNS